MKYPAAERIVALEWVAFVAILLVFAVFAGACVGSVIFAIRVLKG
jgi:hypothetical protein